MVEGRFAELIAGQRQGVLVTLRKDGRPQLSNVNYAWYPEEQTIRVSTTDDRAKTGNMRRDPRVTIEVYAQDDPYQYVTVTGIAELEESDEANCHIDKLSEKYTGNPKFQSHRPNERRVIVRVKPERVS